MCGIAGLFEPRSIASEVSVRTVLQRMASVQQHRGPDDEGFWHDDSGRCSLAQRRLSIIDTSTAGHQPMLDASGRWVITFNGEIYNYLELRAQLEAAGMTFRGRTDTEVLVNAVALWGIDALARIDGMFAFAAFDRASGQLILARDPFGEKPLYYAELAGGGLAFASELQAIECVPGIDATVSPDAVAELLMFQYIGAPRTIYTSVKKLPPGHWLIAYQDQVPRVGRYFEFRPGSSGFDRRPLADLADELEEILVRSLRRRLISDVPLGAFLSGGVDSSTVCALIRRRIGIPLKTFSIGFEGAPESEHETARKFASILGTEHYEQIIAPNASEFLLGIGKVLDEPNADSSCLPTYMLSSFARESVTVALSGDGGDEMFAGYGRYFATLDDESRRSGGVWHPGRAYYSNRILVSLEEHVVEVMGEVPRGAMAHLTRLRDELTDGSPLFCSLRKSDVDNYMPGAVLPKVDRMSMQHSLEVRTPFLSVELARFAERLPLEVLYDGKLGKRVLREIAYRYLPHQLIDLPKQGFGLPMSKWARKSLLGVASQLLESEDSQLGAALGTEAIARFMRRQRSVGGFSTYQAWAMTMLESWLRNHPAQFARTVPAVIDVFATNGTSAEAAIPRQDASPQSTTAAELALWPLGHGVVVITEDPSVQLDAPIGDASSSAVVSEIVHLMVSCELPVDQTAAVSPVTVESWDVLASSRCPRDAKRVISGATLLCPQSILSTSLGWNELASLRTLGVARLVARHPHRGDGAVFVLNIQPKQFMRDFLNVRRLAKSATGRRQLTFARVREGHLRVGGPLLAVPPLESDMSVRFMLFEGYRQLPPLLASHEEVRRLGGGRYSIWARYAYFSRTGRRPASVWGVELNEKTRPLMPYVPGIAVPRDDRNFSSFLKGLEEQVKRQHQSSKPLPPRSGDRIVVLTHALPPGGAERQWCYLALDLKRRGFDVHFVTIFPLDGQNKHYLPLLESAGIDVTRLDKQTPLDALRHLPRDSKQRELSTHLGNPFGIRLAELTALLVRLGPRALFAQLDYSNLIAGVAGLLADVPQIVLSFRNYNPSNFSYLINDWFQPLYRSLAMSNRIALSGNSHVANADYAQWIGVPESSVTLVPNAIDASSFAPMTTERRQRLMTELQINKDTPVVLGVFRLNEEKRPLLFIESCAQIAAAIPTVRAFIAGVGPFESAIRRRIEELGIGHVVTLLGRRDDVPDLMSAASVLLLTSSFEGMPNVVMESQLMGTPVVATRVGGVPDCMIDGETGFIVDLDDFEAFPRRCIEILRDKDLRGRLGAHGAAYMREFFSREAMVGTYLEVLMKPSIVAGKSLTANSDKDSANSIPLPST